MTQKFAFDLRPSQIFTVFAYWPPAESFPAARICDYYSTKLNFVYGVLYHRFCQVVHDHFQKFNELMPRLVDFVIQT